MALADPLLVLHGVGTGWCVALTEEKPEGSDPGLTTLSLPDGCTFRTDPCSFVRCSMGKSKLGKGFGSGAGYTRNRGRGGNETSCRIRSAWCVDASRGTGALARCRSFPSRSWPRAVFERRHACFGGPGLFIGPGAGYIATHAPDRRTRYRRRCRCSACRT